jgi:hypothetical protein
VELTPEFRLIADSCRRCFRNAAASAQPQVAGLDWNRLVRLARFHRVQGLVWKALSPISAALPEEVSHSLAADAAEIAATNLQAAAECGALRAEFEAAGVPLLFVKGLTLGALAYGRSSIKSASDIDLLMPADALDRAAALLSQRAYQPIIPKHGLQRWHRRQKESVWARSRPALAIDLHTRLADHPRLIPAIGIGSPRQIVEVAAGIALPTLARDELFAYLTVHGASSAWFRLKWIADFAALIEGLPGTEVERLYRRSLELGAARAAAQALLLADRLFFGTLDGAPNLRRELCKDRASRWLANTALRQLAGRKEPVEPTSSAGGTVAIHLTQFLLLPGLRFKASELVRQVRSALA